MNELKPCPFCGCGGTILPDESNHVTCCNMVGCLIGARAIRFTKTQWNTRQSTIPISDAKVLVEALEEETRRIDWGSDIDDKSFYEQNKHFNYCSCQLGDVRKCSVCGTYYKMKDALTLAKQLNLTTEKGGE